MAHVYILYSKKLDRYYIGSTALNVEERLAQHNSVQMATATTSRGQPWELVLVLKCTSRLQAQRVEGHIKRMKSRVYLQNLQQYDTLRAKLLARYAIQDS
ncbi:GIY-YIG nuclease family protein [Neolewinella marina]|uniref:GIY-YIG nuclease family protein n=1 Tax=Neolewinella marina TaxID=438751 RepID=UPI00142F5193